MPENPGQEVHLSQVKQALIEIRRLNRRVEELEHRQSEPIAVIGAGLRFPGGITNLQDLWEFLSEGKYAISEVPPHRWRNSDLDTSGLSEDARQALRYGGFLEDIDQFDAQFFGIAPREAEAMDPQQRLLLEVSWEALENAAQDPTKLFDLPVGVFLGICGSDYFRLSLSNPDSMDHYTTSGNALSVAAGRISYLLGLHGPNLAIDTACSSSLVAAHLAVRSLRSGECDLALVGGVNLILSPEITWNFAQAHMLAADGRCKTFDASADGYVRSEGCAIIVLKRLSEALAAGDPIRGVIRGTAINHDGRSGGLTAPNGPMQEAVLSAALKEADVLPEAVGYLEAHGTGTSLGDPIEAGAIHNVLCAGRPKDQPLRIGSIKTNLGHLEAAAGVAGLLKSLLVLEKRQIPAHLHLESVNPLIEMKDGSIEIPTHMTSWIEGAPLIAGVSSFGLSGTNAHVVLEAAPHGLDTVRPEANALRVLPISARSPAALEELAARWRGHLSALSEQAWPAACRTAGVGRAHFDYRMVVTGRSAREMHKNLDGYIQRSSDEGVCLQTQPPGTDPGVTFLFTGHGSNYPNMGYGLYVSNPVFRQTIDECAEQASAYLNKPLLTALFPDHVQGGDDSLLGRMDYAQVGLFALQVALARAWEAWGVQPTCVLGHSAGEYPAGVLAGVFSLEDGMRLVAARSQGMARIPTRGLMATVFADGATVERSLAPFIGKVSIAAYNSPKTVVISGEAGAVQLLLENLSSQGIKSRLLAVPQAAHSPLVEGVLDEFASIAAAVRFSPANISFISTVTGQALRPDEMTSVAYWQRHLRQPVRFVEAMAAAQAIGARTFVEIGPNPVLLALGERCLSEDCPARWLPSLRQGQDDLETMLQSAAVLYSAGIDIDWTAFAPPGAGKATVPTYPFQRKRYWVKVDSPGRQSGRIQENMTLQTASAAEIWQTVQAFCRTQAQQSPIDLNLPIYASVWKFLERLTTAHILNALREMRAFPTSGEWISIDELMRRCSMLPVYRPLVSRWLERLAREGLIEKEAGQYRALSGLPEAGLDEAVRQSDSVLAGLPYLKTYIEGCGKRLVAVLTGSIKPLETLFPGASFDLAEGLYGEWALSRYFAEITRAAVQGQAQFAPLGSKLRILEIGAGTGGTTRAVLRGLPANRARYMFTDVSDLFLARAAEKFADYPFVEYALLDVEQDPASQGFKAGSCDTVIATNVLHATQDLRSTLQNVYRLLKPGGLLLLTEATESLAWFDITTGLIDGWERFKDDLREDSPLLDAGCWLSLLRECGFSAAAAWPEADSPAAILGQAVVVAQVPGSSLPADNREIETPEAVIVEQLKPQQWMSPSSPRSSGLLEELKLALPARREEILLEFVRGALRRVMRLETDFSIEPEQRLMDLGLDSLMALELRRALSSGLDRPQEDLSATLAFDYPTPAGIAAYLDQLIAAQETGRTAGDKAVPVSEDPAREAGLDERDSQETAFGSGSLKPVDISQLSDDEVAELILRKLGKPSNEA